MTQWLCLKAFVANFPKQCLLRGLFFPSLVVMLANFCHAWIRLQKLIWIGPVSRNVSLMVISVVAKIQAFIVNLNSFGR